MRRWFWLYFLAATLVAAQESPAGSSAAQKSPPSSSPAPASSQEKPADSSAKPSTPTPPSANISDGVSSSKDEPFDLSPPPGDAAEHPQSADILLDEGSATGNGEITEFHPWDPHKAAKDVEVGDYYFKRKNYRGAEARYRDALLYKNNDALATIRLAICLEKLQRPEEARKEYENYLKILPHGPQAEEATKAIARLKTAQTTSAK